MIETDIEQVFAYLFQKPLRIKKNYLTKMIIHVYKLKNFQENI